MIYCYYHYLTDEETEAYKNLGKFHEIPQLVSVRARTQTQELSLECLASETPHY